MVHAEKRHLCYVTQVMARVNPNASNPGLIEKKTITRL